VHFRPFFGSISHFYSFINSVSSFPTTVNMERQAASPFSNFHPAPFEIDVEGQGKRKFFCSEQFYMFAKAC